MKQYFQRLLLRCRWTPVSRHSNTPTLEPPISSPFFLTVSFIPFPFIVHVLICLPTTEWKFRQIGEPFCYGDLSQLSSRLSGSRTVYASKVHTIFKYVIALCELTTTLQIVNDYQQSATWHFAHIILFVWIKIQSIHWYHDAGQDKPNWNTHFFRLFSTRAKINSLIAPSLAEKLQCTQIVCPFFCLRCPLRSIGCCPVWTWTLSASNCSLNCQNSDLDFHFPRDPTDWRALFNAHFRWRTNYISANR